MKWEQISKRMQNLGKDRFALLFLAGLMLVIIAMPMGEKKPANEKEKEGTENVASPQTQIESTSDAQEMEEYRVRLCTQLEDFLMQMEGVGKVRVYITMHSTSEIIVERNSPYVRRTEEETTQESTRKIAETENDSEVVLMEQEDGSKAPIVVKEIAPVVSGVVIAAQGGGNETIKKEITALVMALFGIGEHKIRIVKLTT